MDLTGVKSGRERALRAALEVLAEEGLQGLTMRAVAERAGLTAPALYWHFADKTVLVREVMREVNARFRDLLFEALAAPEPEARLRAALGAFRRFAVEQPHYFAAVFRQTPNEPQPALPAPAERRETIFQLLVDRVSDCMRAGVLREGDAREVALMLSAMAQGLVLLYERRRFASEEEFASFYEAALDALLTGLR